MMFDNNNDRVKTGGKGEGKQKNTMKKNII